MKENQDWRKDLPKLEEIFSRYGAKLYLQSNGINMKSIGPGDNRLPAMKEMGVQVANILTSLPEECQKHLVEAYSKAPALFDPERALVCNQNWNKLTVAHIASIDDALNPIYPTISSMKKYVPMGRLMEAVEGMFIETLLSLNVKRGLDEKQIQTAVYDLITSQDFYYLNLAEIAYVLRQGRTGRWNPEGLYNSVGINDLFAWFRKYDRERTIRLEEKNQKEHEKNKYGGMSGDDWDEENLNTLIDTLKQAAKGKKVSTKEFIPKSAEEIAAERERQIFVLKSAYNNSFNGNKFYSLPGGLSGWVGREIKHRQPIPPNDTLAQRMDAWTHSGQR